MGRILAVFRLVVRDVRRRPAEAALFLVAITAATATLSLGLALDGVVSGPYQQTRAATAGPDVVAMPRDVGPAALADLAPLTHAAGVVGHSGPYPVTFPMLKSRGHTVQAVAQGRDTAPASIDRPMLTRGQWVQPGGVVVERSFADALGVRTGDSIEVGGRAFRVVGIAVTAAGATYPRAEWTPPGGGPSPYAGQIWLTRSEAAGLASPELPPSYTLNLKLADPARADAWVRSYPVSDASPNLLSWPEIARRDGELLARTREVMLVFSWLLGVLAIASVAGLVAGRMVEQTRRVGLLKAIGSTPGIVAVVLLVEYLALALLAAGVGLVIGWLTVPLLGSPGPGVIAAGLAAPPTGAMIESVAFLALMVAALTTVVPAVRAARTSTVRALAHAPRPPRRRPWLVALSAWLPATLLLGLRLGARRPRRAWLSAVGIATTVTTIVAVLTYHAQRNGGSSLSDPRDHTASQAMLVLTVVLVLLAMTNAILVTWAAALDARRPLAIARSLGATPRQVSTGLSAAQVLAALPGAIAGVPLGIGLYAVSSSGPMNLPPALWLLATVVGTLLGVAALSAIPARVSARTSVAEILRSETT